MQDHGSYEAKALADFKLRTEDSDLQNKRPFPIWVPRSRRKGSSRLPESPLRETEKELLRTDPKTHDFVMEVPRPTRHRDP